TPGVTPVSVRGQMTPGPDGNVWFADAVDPAIHRVDPAGRITDFAVPVPGVPWGITLGPNGTIAYDVYVIPGTIVIMTMDGHTTLFYEWPTRDNPNPEPGKMTTAPDGSLWWLERFDNGIGELTTSGVFHYYPIPTGGGDATNSGYGAGNIITVGPDGNIWFVEGSVSEIGRITTDGVITEFPVPAPEDPHAIVAGPDGNLWFTEAKMARIGVMSTSGELLHEYQVPPLPGSGTALELGGIALGSDGNLYFATNQDSMGMITTNGEISEI